MDTAQHRQLIAQVLRAEAGPYAIQGLYDKYVESAEGNRFLLIRTGWFKGKNYYSVMEDVELEPDGTVLLHADKDGLAEDLIAAGIPAAAIIKAYDPDQVQRLNQTKPEKPQERMAA